MNRYLVLSVAVVLAVAVAPGCNVFLPAVGGAGQPCKPDLTCNPGLACLQDRCVTMSDGGDGGDFDGVDGADAGSDEAADGDGGVPDAEPDGGDGVECINEDDCDDGNPCTDDTCIGHACVHKPNDGDCDDFNLCTSGDKCVSGFCVGKLEDRDSDGHVGSQCGGDDCNDNNPLVHPGVPEGPPNSETCTDHIDNNCDGKIDAEDIGCRTCNANPDCEDALYCTGPEKCENHLCIRGLSPCDDNLFCTIDICDEQLQICDHGLLSNTCRIGIQCFNHGDRNPANDCQVCNSATPYGWSSLDGTLCNDNDPCTANDLCNKGTCVGTLIDRDSDGYQPPPCGADCDDDNINVHPGADEGPVGNDTCSDQRDNDCDGDIDQNDPGCKCSNDDQCSDHNLCNGQELCLPDGRCASVATSPCSLGAACLDCNEQGCPIKDNFCLIQNACYGDGAHPINGDQCLVCNPSVDKEHWTRICT